ncbi:MAG: ABC transporter permease [Alphaproteobacteria bacterium]|nr:ABC transporter permease [Alphaproteobacteria bacterium]
MLAYTARRVLTMMATLLAISLIVFVIIKLPPGDYLSNQIAELQARGEASALEKVEFLRRQYGLDRPAWEQYLAWVGLWPTEGRFTGLLQGDLGFSFEYQLPVSDIVGDRLFLTFIVSFTTLIFTYIVAFPIGVYSAVRQYSIGDYALTFIGFLGLATPNFLFALVLLYFANVTFGTSIGGLMDPKYLDQPWSLGKIGSVLEHLWIPVIVIGTSGTAGMIRRLRANLLDELQKQYVVTGRAKGLSPGRLLIKYPLRMALNPFIADIGNVLPHIISGAAIVSVVLSLPTTGPMLLEALRSQDQYLAGSFLMFLALLTVIGVFISDLLLALLDPRIRLGGGATK